MSCTCRNPRLTLTPGATRNWIAALAAITVAGLALASPKLAVASVESELAYHRGVAAYGEGDLDTARAHFQTVLAADPGDASALQYMGLIAAKEGDPDRAIEHFRSAVNANPEDPDIRFTLGVSLLHQERAAEAAEEFDRVLAVDPDNAQAEFYAGVSDYRQQRFPETVQHMQAALTLDPSLRLQSRYYIGLAEVFMGNLEASTAALSEAASMSPSDPLAIAAASISKRIQPESRWWGLDLRTGIEFDSNPTFVGSNVAILTDEGRVELERKEDVLGVFSIDTYYDLLDMEHVNLRAGYSAFLSLHDAADEVDQFTHLGWADLGFHYADWRVGTRFDISTTDLDLDEDYLEMRRLSPSVTYANADWGVTQFLYQYHELEYRFDTTDAEEFDADGKLHDVSLSQFIYLPAPFTYARAGVGFQRARTDGTEFEYDGVVVSLGAGVELPFDAHGGVLVQYFHRDYENESKGPDGGDPRGVRDDDIARLKLDLTVPVAQYWEVALRGAFTFNDSNIGDYDFNRHVVGTYVTFTY
ncbi:MAG: tetratricopeptide repeat protein [Myxococcota bacterium]|nr:tetratricopeptide repeat protein [Myxococcota bacterium]